MQKATKSFTAWQLPLIWMVAVVACFVFLRSSETTVYSPGAFDFSQYWSANQLASRGANPYDAAALLEIQSSLGSTEGEATMMWNPPWTLVLLAPVLQLPFADAVSAWMALNIGFAIAIALLLAELLPAKLGRWKLYLPLALTAFSPQIWEAIRWGQLGVFLTLSFVATLFFLSRRRWITAGIVALPLVVKPHLFILIAVVGLFYIIRNRHGIVATSSALAFSLLLLATQLLLPAAFTHWQPLAQQTDGQAVEQLQWKTATAVNVIREQLQSGETPPAWPMLAVPLFAALCCLVWQLKKGSTPLQDMLVVAPWSLFLAPFAWFYDQSVLLPVVILLAGQALAKNNRFALLAILALQLVTILSQQLLFESQNQLFWYPAALGVICLLFRDVALLPDNAERERS